MSKERTGKSLVIEDDPSAARFAQYTLEQEGYEVAVASEGHPGIDIALADSEIDLILLDIMLPDVGGHLICSYLRQDPATMSIPIVMLTATTGERDKYVAMNLASADGYLTKPVDPAKLAQTVKSQLCHKSRISQ